MHKIKSLLTLFFLSGILFSLSSQIYNLDNVPYDNLKNRYDFVSNPDDIISVSAEQQLNNMITIVEDSVSAEIAVVLLKSIGNADIDDFGTALFTKWGIGKKSRDNGLLFLLIEDQRQMIFRTGYGLEGVLPDIILSRIIRDNIAPLMRQGDYDQAILHGIGAACGYLLNPDTVGEIMEQEQSEQQNEIMGLIIFFAIISLLVLLCFWYSFSSKMKMWKTNPDKYNSLNSMRTAVIVCTVLFPLCMVIFAIFYFFKLKKLRNTPINCPRCNQLMVKQSEAEEDAYLTEIEKKEERIKSVDYDVWHCNRCKHNEIFAYDNPRSKYTTCPNCRAKTYFFEKDNIIQNASTHRQGKGEKIYKCINCQTRKVIPYIIPIIVLTSTSGGRSSRGGGFGGGGFGGGRTGGGGARGGW